MRIFWESIRERQRSLFFWVVGYIAFGGLMILFFNEFPDLTFYDDIIAQSPELFSAFVGELTTLSTIEGFLSAELFSLMFPIMMAILGVGLGTSLIAKEESAGTLELLLARPVSRSVIFREKALSLVLQLILMGAAAWIGLIFFSWAFSIEINSVNVAWTLVALMLLVLDFSLLAMALSSLFNRGIAIGITTTLFIISYFVTNLSGVVEALERFEAYSPFSYYRHTVSLISGIDFVDLAILFIPAIFLYWLGLAAFKRRDIGV